MDVEAVFFTAQSQPFKPIVDDMLRRRGEWRCWGCFFLRRSRSLSRLLWTICCAGAVIKGSHAYYKRIYYAEVGLILQRST